MSLHVCGGWDVACEEIGERDRCRNCPLRVMTEHDRACNELMNEVVRRQAARLLTAAEIEPLVERVKARYSQTAKGHGKLELYAAIQRKFCEVNGITLMAQSSEARDVSGSPSSYRARPSDPDLNPVLVKDLSASASPATKEQQ